MKIDQKVIQDIVQKRKEKVDQHVKDTITTCVILNLPFTDQYYIEERAREIINEAMSRVNFESKEIAELRKKFLKANLKELIKKKPARKVFDKNKDLTEARNERCEEVVYEVLNKLLDSDMLFSEDEMIENIFKEQQSHSLFLQVFGFIDAFFNLMQLSVEASYDMALKAKWDGKYKEQITFQDIDRTLKNIPAKTEK